MTSGCWAAIHRSLLLERLRSDLPLRRDPRGRPLLRGDAPRPRPLPRRPRPPHQRVILVRRRGGAGRGIHQGNPAYVTSPTLMEGKRKNIYLLCIQRPQLQRWFATSHYNKSYCECDVANLYDWDLQALLYCALCCVNMLPCDPKGGIVGFLQPQGIQTLNLSCI